jgi:hypothetical protein
MEVLARVQAGSRTIECGLATTGQERAAIQAQRFRVYQRRGYYRPGLQADRDAYDRAARNFLAVLGDGGGGAWLLGSARVILGEPHPGFRFPAERAFDFELPAVIAATTVVQRVEVTRVVAEAVQGIVIGGLLTPLGLIQAIAAYTGPLGIEAGLAVIKRRFLRALQRAGVLLHEIRPARLIYPEDGAVCGYYHRHPDPVVPVCWRVAEIAPSVEQAIASYESRHIPPPDVRDLPRSSSPGGSTRGGPEARDTTELLSCQPRLTPCHDVEAGKPRHDPVHPAASDATRPISATRATHGDRRAT